MIKPGTKYRIVGVHDHEGFAFMRKELLGAIIEAVDLKRWQAEQVTTGYWYGEARFVEVMGDYFEPGETTHFLAVYLRRVKEEAK